MCVLFHKWHGDIKVVHFIVQMELAFTECDALIDLLPKNQTHFGESEFLGSTQKNLPIIKPSAKPIICILVPVQKHY